VVEGKMYECSTCKELHKNAGLAKLCENRHKIEEEQRKMEEETQRHLKEQERLERESQPDPLVEKLARHVYLKRNNKTPYSQLAEQDKESSRHEARKIIKIFDRHIADEKDLTVPKELCPDEMGFLAQGNTVGLKVYGPLTEKGVKVSHVELIRG